MGAKTGIAWTDSTYNSWWGCMKVGPACDDCYAEATDERAGGGHWGQGATRRLLSETARNEPLRWQRNAGRFFEEHGRRRRVFTLSMGDLFDKEVPDEWREGHFAIIDRCPDIDWQICTKRVGNVARMVPTSWLRDAWPANVGLLVTTVTQAEADRDIPKLRDLKRHHRLPWIGVSWEPAQEPVDFSAHLPAVHHHPDNVMSPALTALIGSAVNSLGGDYLDWIIFGGKSGRNWNDRPFDADWARPVMASCAATGVAFFFKQVAAFRPTDAMIPADMMVRQFPNSRGATLAAS